jgi:Nucleotidyltransferase domain
VTLSKSFAQHLIERFVTPSIKALVLTGSYARGDADSYSDVDILRLAEDGATLINDGSLLLEHRLVTVSTAFSTNIERWFTEPGLATQIISGLRQAQALHDPDEVFVKVQARANAFTWNETLQVTANQQASEQMVGLIEEVQKGLGGLQNNNVGRLLQTRYALSWLLAGVIQVQHGILIESDNSVVSQLTEAVGLESSWSYWCYRAFGLENPGLRQEVLAGLNLYVETYKLVRDILRSQDKVLVTHAIRLIEQARVLL